MFQKKLSGEKLSEFYNYLSLFDANSIPIVQAIQYLSTSDEKNKMYKNMCSRAANTSKLSNIVKGYIPDKHLQYFKVAEGHGNISAMLVKLEKLQKLEIEMKSKIKKSVTMPIILFFCCILIIIGYGTKVLPSFESLIPLEEWPLISLSLIKFAEFALSIKAVFFTSFTALIIYFLIYYLIYSNSEFRNNYLDKLPIFKIYKSFISFSFLNKFYFLVEMGIGYHDALKIISNSTKGRLKYFVEKMILNGGDNAHVDEVIDVGLIEHQDVLLMGMFSKNKSFETAIAISVDRGTDKIEKDIELAGTSLKVIMLVVVAVVILWTYMSVNLLVMEMV